MSPSTTAMETQCDIWTVQMMDELQYEIHENENYIHEMKQVHQDRLAVLGADAQIAKDTAARHQREGDRLQRELIDCQWYLEEEKRDAEYNRANRDIESRRYAEVYCSRGFMATHRNFKYHTYDDCDSLEDRHPVTLDRCPACVDRLENEIKEMR